MKLSEAIRRGCKLRLVKCTGDYLAGETAACALGAAALGAGVGAYCESLFRRWPRLLGPGFTDLPAGHGELFDQIALLNDREGYGREDIAAWLESHGL